MQREAVPGRLAAGVARRRTPAGSGRSRARSAVVRTNAATPSTGMSQSNRQTGSAISGAARYSSRVERPVVPVRPRQPGTVLAGLDHDRAERPRGWRRSAGSTRWRPGRSSPAARRSPAASSTATRRAASLPRRAVVAARAGCAAPGAPATWSAAPLAMRVDRRARPSPGSGRSPGSRWRSRGSTPSWAASQFGDTVVTPSTAAWSPAVGSSALAAKPSISVDAAARRRRWPAGRRRR